MLGTLSPGQFFLTLVPGWFDNRLGNVLGVPRRSGTWQVLQALWDLQNVAFEGLTFLIWVDAHLGQLLWGRFEFGEVFELTVAVIALLAAIDAFEDVFSANPVARPIPAEDAA